MAFYAALYQLSGPRRYAFASGHCAFSFIELGINGERGFMKPGNKMSTIHTPVPGFASHLGSILTKVFRSLKAGRPFWRANWAVTPTGEISPHEHVQEEATKDDSCAATTDRK